MSHTRKVALWRRIISHPHINAPVSFAIASCGVALLLMSPVGMSIWTAIATSDDRTLTTTLTVGLVLLTVAFLTAMTIVALHLLNRPRRRS